MSTRPDPTQPLARAQNDPVSVGVCGCQRVGVCGCGTLDGRLGGGVEWLRSLVEVFNHVAAVVCLRCAMFLRRVLWHSGLTIVAPSAHSNGHCHACSKSA